MTTSCKVSRLSAFLLLMIIFNQSSVDAGSFEAQENVPLTLFQLLARSDLVVQARVIDGEGRYAVVEVIGTFLGTSPAVRLRIDFRDLNFERRGQEIVVFRKDEEYILLLERPNWRKPKEKNRDILFLFHGRRGRMAIPAEGGALQVQAVERMATLVGRTPDDQIAGLRSMATSPNQLLRESALEELARLRAADASDLHALALLLQDANPRIRVAALAIIRGVMPQPANEAGEAQKRAVLEICRERARNDPSDQVRVGAVRVLGAWAIKEEVAGDLRAIGSGDASQSVRYEALRILYGWGMTGPAAHP